MPRGTRIAPAERRNWLEQYEQRSRIDKIAHEAGRTQRTINEHLAQAGRERQQQEVTAGLLTQAYQRHFAQLLEVAETLGQAAQKVNPGGIRGTADLDTKMLYQGTASPCPQEPALAGYQDLGRVLPGIGPGVPKAAERNRGAGRREDHHLAWDSDRGFCC